MGIRMQDKQQIITDAAYITPAPITASIYSWYQSMGIHDLLVDVAFLIAIIAALGRCIIIWKQVFKRDKDKVLRNTKPE